MKIPQRPPFEGFGPPAQVGPSRLFQIIQRIDQPTVGGQYHHWDKLRHLTPPVGLTHQEWWMGLKFQRLSQRKVVPLKDVQGRAFFFTLADPIPEILHRIDISAGGVIQASDPNVPAHERDRYLIRSLMEEAITSSQIEGAATTRVVAKQMLRTGRPPRDTSEQMILNNYLAMKQILATERDCDLTPDFIFELHSTLTRHTLDNPDAAGRCRTVDERVVVEDAYGEVLHAPPAAEQLLDRLQAMCLFANGQTPEYFVHPVLRSIILHFWLAYDHPFVDGNGRCARALFYWSMLRHKFWLTEFISISEVIKSAQSQYGRAFLQTETDGNDLTYFILYHLDVIEKSVRQLHQYIQRKSVENRAVERLIRRSTGLNHRQRALLSHALRHPDAEYTTESHQTSHQVVYQTARTDLHDLASRGLLQSRKIGRTFVFHPPPDLESRLSNA